MTVAVVRLLSGEEIIFNVKDESNDGYLVVTAPHVVHTQFDPQNGFRFGFAPFMVYARGGELKIPLGALSAIGIPDEGMEAEYIKRTDPKALIVPPEKKIILS